MPSSYGKCAGKLTQNSSGVVYVTQIQRSGNTQYCGLGDRDGNWLYGEAGGA